MFKVTTPLGNIYSDEEFEKLKSKDFEKLEISRIELEKRILRKKTNRGTDIALSLAPGISLRNGDVLRDGDVPIIVQQLAEKVITILLKTDNKTVMIVLGHIIGNRHRPISIEDEKITFPIQADSEKEVFEKLFHSIINYIDIVIEMKIFFPNSGCDVHEH